MISDAQSHRPVRAAGLDVNEPLPGRRGVLARVVHQVEQDLLDG